MEINGYTRLAAVVANPIKHSLSPFIHNLAFGKAGVNGVYLAWEIEAEHLGAVVENVRHLEMFGLNLSMPFKTAVIPFLDELSPEAQLIGAVNTVALSEGRLIGHNTDGIGFFKSLKGMEFEVAGAEIVVLGGGGAALAIITQAALLGARRIHVFARSSASFLPLKARLMEVSAKTGVEILLTDLSANVELQKGLRTADLLVNATSVGMDGQAMPFSDTLRLSEQCVVVDIIYKVHETPFLKWAKAQGAQTQNGLGMLLGQAAESFRIWTGVEMPVDEMEQKLKEKLAK